MNFEPTTAVHFEGVIHGIRLNVTIEATRSDADLQEICDTHNLATFILIAAKAALADFRPGPIVTRREASVSKAQFLAALDDLDTGKGN